MMNEIGINRFGLAYQSSPKVAAVTSDTASGLKPGDRIKSVRLLLSPEDTPEYIDPAGANELRKGRELSRLYPLSMLVQNLQIFEEGTQFEVHAIRGDASTSVGAGNGQADVEDSGTDGDNKSASTDSVGERVVTTLTIVKDDIAMFERGLNFLPSEQLRKAGSAGEALSLGLKEGKRRFYDVVRFLTMLPQGQVKLRHVGGPLAIVDIAKGEAEKGISRQLMFLTMLSMNLAILNFLPIPALDGGHMVFLAYELVAGKRANEQLEFRLTVAGLLSLLALMVVVFANDVMRFIN
jgi:regulator of sigma E protease